MPETYFVVCFKICVAKKIIINYLYTLIYSGPIDMVSQTRFYRTSARFKYLKEKDKRIKNLFEIYFESIFNKYMNAFISYTYK